MRARLGSFVLFSVSSLVAIAIASSGCEQASGPPPETPDKATARPPDRTEVTMELSDAAPPGEKAAALGAPSTPAPSATPSTTAAAADPTDDPTIGGAQSDPAVEKAVAPVRPRLRACYKKALVAESGIGGSATFDATIAKDGKVASARFVKRDGLNEDMVGCLLVAVKAMTFEPGKKSQIVTLTFGSGPSSAAATPDAGTKH